MTKGGGLLDIKNTILIVTDIQGNLAQVMLDKALLFDNTKKLIKGIRVFNIPIIVTEQLPEKLGPTVPELADLLQDVDKISKASFSCCKNSAFMNRLSHLRRRRILLTGIEAHICVYQTAVDLLAAGYEVHCVADAVSSRTALNKRIGLRKMCDCGAALTSTEIVLFELLQTAESPQAKEIFKIVK